MNTHRTLARVLAGLAASFTLVVGVSMPAQASDTGWNGTSDTGWNGTGTSGR